MKAAPSCLFLLLASLAAAAAAPPPTEAELAMKTEALLNLPRYIEWPDGAFVIPKTPVMIGVYGHSKIHKALLEAANGKLINGRRVMVRRYHWPQLPNAHVLYIAPSERHRLPWIMKKLEYSTTVTVSDFDDFLTRGGMVRMSMKDERLRFHVNTITVKDVGLKFSSQFLTVADQVVGEP
jgi:hypothetical protein